ncbi:MAG: hypothetical protein A2289_23445 [Deltaproteobacteria bacterium RIFOXYA12_FULL_58_15]|nr:MAG: hypothetical protein A2289_23445 [Deltaproteobacteria bacterium RIFOXYA12_FULL_58_15]
MAELVGRHHYQGHFGASYTVHIGSYDGPDFSRTCFVFPGQSSAYPGMGKGLLATQERWEHLLQPADALCRRLGLPGVARYFAGPDDITETELPLLQNIALFVLEVAYGEALQELNIHPVVITAHSFGEYAAFVCAGMISFEDMLQVVAERDRACPPPGELGRLVAIEGSVDDVTQLLDDIPHSVSNVNAPTQTVVAIRTTDLPRARGYIAASNRRFKELVNVAQPYHSALLEPARQRFADYLRGCNLRISPPKIPLFSSVTAKVLSAETFAPEQAMDLLSAQLTATVLFQEQILRLYDQHRCFTFMEVGPKTVSIDLVSQILGEQRHRTQSAERVLETRWGQAEIRHARDLALRHNKFFALVSEVVGRVTGYDVKGISVEDRFQDQLGIDSIKKAEIVVRLLREANIAATDVDLSNMRSVGDAIRMLDESVAKERTTQAPKSPFVAYRGMWQRVALAKSHPLLRVPKVDFVHLELDALLDNAAAADPTMFRRGRGAQGARGALGAQGGQGAQGMQIWVLHCPAAPWQEPTAEGSGRLLDQSFAFFRALRVLAGVIDAGPCGIVVAASVKSPWAEAVAAAIKSLSKELRNLMVWDLQFEPDIPAGQRLEELITADLCSPAFESVRYINGERWVHRLQPASAQSPPHFAPGFVVVALGGARGITAELLMALPDQQNIVLIVLGRSDRNAPEIKASLARFDGEFSAVDYLNVDARDFSSFLERLNSVVEQHGRIDLLLVGAGVEHSQPLLDKPDHEIAMELATKLVPLFVAQRMNDQIRQVSFLSSIVAVYGNAGQCAYAFANAMLAQAVASRQNDDGTANDPATNDATTWRVVHWPPWDNVGMTATAGMSLRLQQLGLSLLDPREAGELFRVHGLDTLGSPIVLPMTDDDRFSYALGLGRKALLHGVVGESLGAGTSFARRVSLERLPALADHAIGTRLFFPAAYFVEMMLAVAALGNTSAGRLDDLRVLAPLVLEGERLLSTRIRRAGGGQRLTIETNLLHVTTVLSYAPAEFSQAPQPQWCNRVLGSGLYGAEGLFHGPRFQLLPWLMLDAGGELAGVELDLESHPWSALPVEQHLSHVIDAAFQVFSALGSIRAGWLAIPVAAKSLHFDLTESLGNRVTIVGRLRHTGELGFLGDCWVNNQVGQPVIELRELEHRFFEDEQGRRTVAIASAPFSQP